MSPVRNKPKNEMEPILYESHNYINKQQSKHQIISNGVKNNKKNKSFLLSQEGVLFLFILFWAALLFRNSFIPKETESLIPLWFQLFYIFSHIFSLIFLVFLAWGLGRKFSKAFKIQYSDVLEEFPFAISLGLGSISIIMLILGGIKLFYPIAIYVTTGILLILTTRELKEIISEISKSLGEIGNIKLDVISILILCLIGLTTLILLTGTFTLPLSYDGLAYHLGVIKTYIKAHGIIPLPYHVYSNFPFNIEMLYAYSILLTGDEILAKMMHFLTAILVCFALYAFGKKYFDRKIGLLSAAIFLNIRLVCQLSTLCYNDLGLTLFVFLTIFAFINWYSASTKDRPNWLILCGILTGLTLGTKYFGITFLFIFLFLAVGIGSMFITTPQRKTAYLTKNLIIFSGITFCVFLPWMVKNLIITGNPLFPFLYPIFKGGNWTSYEYQRFLNVHLPHIFTFKEFFSQLWALLTNAGFGLAFVLILPFVFLLKKKDAKIKFFGVYATYYYLVWFFFTHRVDRFMLPLYAFLSLIVAYTLFNLPKKPRILAGSFLTIIMAFNLLTLIVIAENTGFGEAFSGIKTKEEYLEEKLYYYPAIKYMNEELTPSSKILFIGDNQTYYCENPLLSNSPLDRSIIVEVVKNSMNGEEVKNKLKMMGITHIYYNATEVKRTQETYSSFDWGTEEEYTKFLDFMENHTQTLFDKDGCFVLELINGK